MATLEDDEYNYKPINSGYSILSDYGIDAPPYDQPYHQEQVTHQKEYPKLISLHGDKLRINGIEFNSND